MKKELKSYIKNVERKLIIDTRDNFEHIIMKYLNDDIVVSFDNFSLTVLSVGFDKYIDSDKIYNMLSKYYGVKKIIDIIPDRRDCHYSQVWITYRNK